MTHRFTHLTVGTTHGLPVVATRVGDFPETVRDGVDGLICEPDDEAALARTLRSLYESPQLRPQLRAAVQPADSEAAWRRYMVTLLTLAESSVS